MLLTDYELLVCEETGNLLVYAYEDYNFDMEEYFIKFFNSKIGKYMDVPYTKYQHLGASYVNDEFVRYIKDINSSIGEASIKYNKDILFWMGYLVRYWNFLYYRHISQLINLIGFKELYNSYSLHILSIEMAIEKIYLKYENKNRLTLLDIKDIKREDNNEVGEHFLLKTFDIIE